MVSLLFKYLHGQVLRNQELSKLSLSGYGVMTVHDNRQLQVDMLVSCLYMIIDSCKWMLLLVSCLYMIIDSCNMQVDVIVSVMPVHDYRQLQVDVIVSVMPVHDYRQLQHASGCYC